MACLALIVVVGLEQEAFILDLLHIRDNGRVAEYSSARCVSENSVSLDKITGIMSRLQILFATALIEPIIHPRDIVLDDKGGGAVSVIDYFVEAGAVSVLICRIVAGVFKEGGRCIESL